MATSRKNVEQLTRMLELAGAPDPASWASSEVNEDIPQLSRFMFLRQAWKSVVVAGDNAWIESEIVQARLRPDDPGSGLGPALQRLLSSGCNPDDLSVVARTMQWQLLFNLCYLLSDPGIEEPELAQIGWGLFEMDEAGNIGRPIGGLHESVLETDPTGQEMRPGPAA